MPHRYLFGPVSADFADQKLRQAQAAGYCLPFDLAGATGFRVSPEDTWESVHTRLPAGWEPDFIALALDYTCVPEALWDAPMPRVGLASDWNLLWHYYRLCLPRCELVLADTAGVEAFGRAGIRHVRAVNLYGCGRSWLGPQPPYGPRDIDVLFVGNFHPAVQRERLPWLARLAQLAGRWRVVLRGGVFGGVFGDDYRALLSRSRVVFNRGIRGECNQRAFEATAAGALLFQEADNREVPDYFTPGRDYVAYGEDDLEALLEHYLRDECARAAVAESARPRVQGYGYEIQWERQLALIEKEWSTMRERLVQRPTESHGERLRRRTWQLLSCNTRVDPTLVGALSAGATGDAGAAALHNALGLAATVSRPRTEWLLPDAIAEAVGHFRRAVACDPDDPVAGLNLAEALVRSGAAAAAAAEARRILSQLAACPDAGLPALDGGHYPAGFDHFRVEWERAAWANAGDPAGEVRAKCELLRWRLHGLLGALTGSLAHAEEAVRARPDLPPSQATLGQTLLRLGRPTEAILHLRQAVAANPFDRDAAQSLFRASGAAGDWPGQARLVRERALLARAAPGLVPVEPWFAEVRPTRNLPGPAAPAPLLWEGHQWGTHSYTRVNREVCTRLALRGQPITFMEPGKRLATQSTGAGLVHVRHKWPPDFLPPSAGHWVMVLPWEFGSLPQAWVGPLTDAVDEVWVYTHYLRRCYLQAGVPADRVHVVPLGVDVMRYRPGVRPYPLRTRKRFKLLFVGGTIHRKGFDVFLDAYGRAFTDQDDVCLVVKDVGVDTFYRGQTAGAAVAAHQARPGTPAIEYIDCTLADEDLPGIYAACDCLVHPYRGEGFGLPIAEAMACGLPVVVTGYGAALDFCDDANAYLIPARVVRLPERRVGAFETVDHPWLAEPDAATLAAQLRHVAMHSEEARAKGAAGAARIQGAFTWDHTATAVEARLRSLRRQPVRRQARLVRVESGERPVVSAAPRPPAQAARPRVSLCMIVRDEADKLAACLRSVADLVDEMVVVDTGSLDRTKEVAAHWGARVFDFAWCDSFAAARNDSLQRATGDWAMWLDADEHVDGENRQRLRALLAELGNGNMAFVMRQLSEAGDPAASAAAVDQVRLFRNRPDVRWEYRVHEQILLALRRAGHEVRWTDVVIAHGGYQDGQLSGRKLERNLRLLRLEEAERPGDAITLYHLGLALGQAGRTAEALAYLRRSLERTPPDYSTRPRIYAMLGRGHHRLGQPADALAACREGLRDHPDDVELVFLEGLLLRDSRDLRGAEASLLRLLGMPARPRFGAADPGLSGHKARHLLGEVYCEQGRSAEAEAQWRAAVAERPGFVLGWQSLGELYHAQARLAELDEAVRGLLRVAPNHAWALARLAELPIRPGYRPDGPGAAGAGLPAQ